MNNLAKNQPCAKRSCLVHRTFKLYFVCQTSACHNKHTIRPSCVGNNNSQAAQRKHPARVLRFAPFGCHFNVKDPNMGRNESTLHGGCGNDLVALKNSNEPLSRV
jgi:hypothetical protein